MISSFGLVTPGRILFGRGRAAEAPPLIAVYGKRIFVTHGRSPERGLWMARELRAIGCEVLTFACPTEPNLDIFSDALAAARDFGAEAVVAIGGGSAMDLGKAVAALAPGKTSPLDHLEVVGRGKPLDAIPRPFIAIPTTAGTGSEATRNAVITLQSFRRKASFRDDRILARLAIVDPALTDATPRTVTLASGLDAITQVIEPYLSTGANPFTDGICRTAIPSGLAALTALMEDEIEEARDAMSYVSLIGGIALTNAGLGSVHGLVSIIGGMIKAPHGALCGALLPHVLRMHAARHDESTLTGNRMAEIMGWLSGTFGKGDGIGALEDFIHQSGLPRLSKLGLSPEDHSEVGRHARTASSTKTDPSRPNAGDLCDILLAAG